MWLRMVGTRRSRPEKIKITQSRLRGKGRWASGSCEGMCGPLGLERIGRRKW